MVRSSTYTPTMTRSFFDPVPAEPVPLGPVPDAAPAETAFDVAPAGSGPGAVEVSLESHSQT